MLCIFDGTVSTINIHWRFLKLTVITEGKGLDMTEHSSKKTSVQRAALGKTTRTMLGCIRKGQGNKTGKEAIEKEMK